MKLFTAFCCGLFLGISSFLWHFVYLGIIAGLVVYILHGR